MGNSKSQETLDSIGLQSSSERGPEEQEEMTGEGNYSLRPKMDPHPFYGSVRSGINY